MNAFDPARSSISIVTTAVLPPSHGSPTIRDVPSFAADDVLQLNIPQDRFADFADFAEVHARKNFRRKIRFEEDIAQHDH